MINVAFSIIDIWIAIAIIVVGYVIARYLVGFVMGIVLGSTWYILWQRKRQIKAKKMLQKTEKQELYESLKKLSNFIDWLDKQFPNSKQRKQFWRDWTEYPATRQKWMTKFLDQYRPEMKFKTTKKGEKE